LPQTTINKAMNDLRKRLNAYVSAYSSHFSILYELCGRA